MCKALVARKFDKIICKVVLNDNFSEDKEYESDEDLKTIYIKKDYIGIEEKEAFKKWYQKADWYGYDNENDAMKRLNNHGDFKEDVLPSEIVGEYGSINIEIEEIAA